MGRSFDSQKGGLYLSVILRPNCSPKELMHLTCAAGTAACDAVEKTAGLRPGIKWINDLVLDKRKLGGILTELSVNPKTGLVDYAIIGVGINCLQSTFPAGLESIATSLLAAGRSVPPDTLAAALVEALYDMNGRLLTEKPHLMELYRKDCITLGQDILIHKGDTVTPGKALDIDDEGALIVRLGNGTLTAVNSGEVSVRGMFGYI